MYNQLRGHDVDRKRIWARFFVISVVLATGSLYGASFYPNRLDDPGAVYLTPESFPVQGDGVADDSGGRAPRQQL